MWLLLLIAPPVLAGSPWTLPEGSGSVYAGFGQSTFATGMSGLSRDRYIQSRAMAWVGRGVSDRTQVEVSLPFTITRVVEDPDEGPCPSLDDYCARTLALGALIGAVQTRVLGGALPTAIRVGVQADSWNASMRGRWTNPGQGTVDGTLDVVSELATDGETRWRLGGSAGVVVPWPSKAVSEAGEVRWSPAPTVRAVLEGGVRRDIIEVTLALYARQRVAGEVYGADWVRQWRPTIDRWRVTRWGELRPELRVSFLARTDWGVHAAVSRSVWVVAGPPDLWDASLGVHVYLPAE